MTGIVELVRLEVEADPPAGVLVNRLSNPSGELGGSGWITPNTGDTVNPVLAYTPTALRAIRGKHTSPLRVVSVSTPIAPGQHVGGSWLTDQLKGALRARLRFYDAAGAVLTDSAWSAWTTTGSATTRRSVGPAQAPASAASVALDLALYKNTSATIPAKGAYFWLREAMLAIGATAAEVTNPTYSAAEFWTDVTPHVSLIETERTVLDLGTLTATVHSSALDPATSPALRSGRRCRLSAAQAYDGSGNPTDFDVIFRGKLGRPVTVYDPDLLARNHPRAARITITATDAHAALASRKTKRASLDYPELPAILELAGVPWSIEGNPNQATLTTTRCYDASSPIPVLEHVQRIRNGYYSTNSVDYVAMWIDRAGLLQVWDDDRIRDTLRALLPDRFFEDGTGIFNARSNCEVTQVVADPTYGTALKATATTAGNIQIDSDPVPVDPGAEYSFDFRHRLTTVGRRVVTAVQWYTAADTFISQDIMADTTGYSTSSYLGYFDRRAVAPTNAAYARVATSGVAFAAGESLYSSHTEGWRYADAVITNADLHEGTRTEFGDENNFNILTLDSLVGRDSGAAQLTLGPFQNTASVNANGPREVTVPTAGYAAGDSNLTTYANYLLGRNATPVQHVAEAVYPIRTIGDVRRHAFRDLYDRLRFAFPIAQISHVTRVKHSIRATADGGRWTVTTQHAGLDRLVL